MSQTPSVLILDDSQTFLDDFEALMSGTYNVLLAESEEKAFEVLNKQKVDLMFLDLMLGAGKSGIDVLKRIKQSLPDFPVIMVTAHASVESAVEAMKAGAYHYISKSPNIEELKALVEMALEQRTLKREYKLLREQMQRAQGKLVGRSAAMQEVVKSIHRVAMTDVTVLITGESGTGKELVARAIHGASKRSVRPFVVVNCASLVKDLIESELFGHQKGSFTGAIQTKPGKFELADGGTIFLDEIAELDLHSQVRLLRVLQERVIDRIGGSSPIPVDVRVITATNRDLEQLIERGEFREDLFYRLNVFPIGLPPLRDRKDDIPLLLDYFLDRYGVELGKSNLTVDPPVVDLLMQYDWYGNVREFENIIQRAILLCSERTILVEHLPREMDEGKQPPLSTASLLAIEKRAKENAARSVILKTLERTQWNVKESAQLLGIPAKTLYDRCSRLGIKLSNRNSE